jgi:putative membrane protein
MTGLFPGSWHPDVLAGVALVAGVYVAAARRVTPGPTARERVAFAAGLAVLTLSLNGPLHDLSDAYLFSAHMAQHLVLTLLVSPLLLAGLPAAMIDTVLGPPRGLRAVALHALTRPLLALGLYTVALVVWHLPGPYGLALERHGLHIAQHLTLMVTATLAWWPVMGRSRIAPAQHYGAQILYLFAFGIPMTVVAAMITGAENVLYPFYAAAPRITGLDVLGDQRLGGLIMWVPAGLIPLGAFTAVFFRWAAAEHEADDTLDVAIDIAIDESPVRK